MRMVDIRNSTIIFDNFELRNSRSSEMILNYVPKQIVKNVNRVNDT